MVSPVPHRDTKSAPARTENSSSWTREPLQSLEPLSADSDDPSSISLPSRSTPRESVFDLHLWDLTSAQLLLALSAADEKQYRRMIVHCLLFDALGRTLMIRHPAQINPILHPELHDPKQWCSPYVTAFMPSNDGKDKDDVPVARIVSSFLPCRTRLETTRLLARFSTWIPFEEDDGTIAEQPAIVVVVGVQRESGAYLELPPSMCDESVWVGVETAKAFRGGCRCLWRADVAGDAVQRWKSGG